MGKKNKKPKETQEKVITGSGADVVSHEDEQGRVKCKCIVPCVWRGYRDEGDTVWIEKELIEKDAFIRMHFEAVDGVVADAGQDGDGGSDNADGADGNGDGGSDNADGADGNGNGGSDNADGADGNGDGANGNGEGQGELDLK